MGCIARRFGDSQLPAEVLPPPLLEVPTRIAAAAAAAAAAKVGCRSGRVKTDLGLTATSRHCECQAACCWRCQGSDTGSMSVLAALCALSWSPVGLWIRNQSGMDSRMEEGGLWRGRPAQLINLLLLRT